MKKKSIDRFVTVKNSSIYGHRCRVATVPMHCPTCGDEEIEYGLFVYDDGGKGYFPAKCVSKGHRFEEWFDLQFQEGVKRPKL